MGTQQVLMITLSVIVVGAAIAVGIMMFDTQSTNQLKNALVMDVNNVAFQAKAWWRTPTMMGGGGYRKNLTNSSLYNIAKYVDKNATFNPNNPASAAVTTPNGSFGFTGISGGYRLTVSFQSHTQAPNAAGVLQGAVRGEAVIFLDGKVNPTMIANPQDALEYDQGVRIIFNN
jgi:hypothetical protein